MIKDGFYTATDFNKTDGESESLKFGNHIVAASTCKPAHVQDL